MKIDLFENKYKVSNIAKVLFIDIVCFLLFSVISVSVCYAYFSSKADVTGTGTLAGVSVEYHANVDSAYISVSEIYVDDGYGASMPLANSVITPGDTITIVGHAVNTSDVGVYAIAKVTVNWVDLTEEKTEDTWYTVGGKTGSEFIELTMDNNGIYQVGAGSIDSKDYIELAIPYTFDGATYENTDQITKITVTLYVHQKDHLRNASDFENYSAYEDASGKINEYATESIYATHYMTGNIL